MDIEAISGPKLRDSIKRKIVRRSDIEPVVQSGPISIVDDGTRYAPHLTWIIEDRVTISARARRKYNEMMTENE